MDPLNIRAQTPTERPTRNPEIELLHKKISGMGMHYRKQQMELHELRCTVREYKAMLDNMQDEVRMIRNLLDKKWLPGASPRGPGAGDRGPQENGYYVDGNGHGKAGVSKRNSRISRSGGDTNITHEEIVELACTVLRRYPGGMAIAKLGTLMHKEANNHALPSILKERYGGLKKFLQGQQDKCVMGNDHPYNPHVTLRTTHRSSQLSYQQNVASPRPVPGMAGSGGSAGALNAPAIGDPYDASPASVGWGEGEAYGRTPRRRRSKKSKGGGHSPPKEILNPGTGGPSTQAVSQLLQNAHPVPRTHSSIIRTQGPPSHRHAQATSNTGRSSTWTGQASAPGTPLGTWTMERERPEPNSTVSRQNSSMTPDGGSRSSSLFTSSLSTRLRTNVLKSAYTIRLPPYPGGTKMTRQMALCCGMVEVGTKGDERSRCVARVVVVNLYGHVLFDEFVRPNGDILDYDTAVTGVKPGDMKKAVSLSSAREHITKLFANRIVVVHNAEKTLKGLQMSLPHDNLRDIARHLGAADTPLPQLVSKMLGLSVTVRNPIEDARAIIAMYYTVHKEWERNVAETRRAVTADKTSWPLPDNPLQPHEVPLENV
uniref:Exonuclease domain-containing protein n=1 Tax=Lotharella globosa TaxID=91324 RepID=A0A6V3MD37_9EUKA|mmetsp:Transcript_6143/g.12190  ORF Transcript_6143/g.12190 Transcript_6143/m.12190 type:complete len:599 (+) Transcript_6143:79-1875(+)